ncbi:unnamed protein product, partial [Iphiclides podalirius]
MTSPTKRNKVVDQLQKNPYFEKYADRIAALQKTSPEEFLERLEKQNKNKEEEKKKKFGSVDTRQFSSVLNPKKALTDDIPVDDKKLDTIFKLDLGYEFIMCQCYGQTVHFTPLLAFQVHKENAPECLTMIHYTELRSKGIVLMRGEYDKNVLNGQEAQCLANQFQMYFSGKDQAKLQLLETFNKKPDSFKHMDLIAELENITLV